MAKDFTIVIAHRGNALGFWATITSCEMELQGQGFDYNYVIVENGIYQGRYNESKRIFETEVPIVDPDFITVVDELEKGGKLRQKLLHPNPLSPPAARQMGVQFVDGKYIFFFDNHCIVEKDYFRRAIADFENNSNIAVLHSSYKYYFNSFMHYEYKMTLEKNFWGEASMFPQNELKPYRVGMCGHGGFAVRKDVWDAVGGYWDGFDGYGGEEPYFDLKCWEMGYEVWIDPRVVHYHFAGNRGYRRHYTDEYYINMMCVANIIGGQHWLEKVGMNFMKNYPKSSTGKSMFDLQMIAQEKSQDHADYLASIRKRDLDETLAYFRANLIAH